jgi:translocation and assembly module TamB
MRRRIKIALAIAGVVVGFPLLCPVLVVAGGNIGVGRHLIERAVPLFTDGKVKIDGLSGRFPDRLRIGRIIVGDASGSWLTIDRARFDWSPLRLIDGKVNVEILAADHVAVARLPGRSASEPAAGTSTPWSLPLGISVDALSIKRLDLAAPVAGAPATLRITGDLRFTSLSQGRVTLEGERLDSPGSYKLSGVATPDRLAARITVAEPAHGVVSGFAGLPDLGPLTISAAIEGPRNDEEARFSTSAGALTAEGHGKIDLTTKTLDLDLTAAALQMAPRPDLSWQAAKLDAHLHGAIAAPSVTGHLDIEQLKAVGGSIGRLAAGIQGDNGAVGLTASASELRAPGLAPDLFASAPIELRARATVNAARRSVNFTLSHPLLSASGDIDVGKQPTGSVTVTVPSLAPYAAVTGADLQGHATVTAKLAQHGSNTTTVGVDGILGITGGLPIVAKLIGRNATVALTGALHGGDLTLGNFAINGRALSISAKGTESAGVLDLDWQAALSDLSILAANAAGALSVQGHIGGPQQDLSATAQLTGEAAVAGLPKEAFTASLAVQGLPASPSGKIEAEGRLAGAPLQLAAAANRRSDGTLALSLDRLQWKSVSGEGKLTLARGALVPLGRLQLRVARLGDLAPLSGLAASGSIDAALDTVEQRGKPQVRLHAVSRGLSYDKSSIDQLTLDAQIADPTTRPVLAATVAAVGIRQGAITGGARLVADGPLDALGLRLSSDWQTPQGPARLAAVAAARLSQRDVQLSSFNAGYGAENARLLAPARVSFANGVTVDNLRLGVGGATIALAGRITPTLSLKVTVSNVTPVLAKPWAPSFNGAGTIALNGDLRGTLAAPEGSLHLTGRGLKVMMGSIGGLPAADIDATAKVARDAAQLDAHVTAGTAVRLALSGTVPLQPARLFALRVSGNADLALLDPLLTASGRAVRGQTTINLALGGPLTAPQVSGAVRLANGSVRDYVQGIQITDLNGLILAEGNTLRITQLNGRAGSGTLSVTGTVGVLQPNLPVSLTVTAHDARLLASDLLSATANLDLTLRGELAGNLSAGGEIRVVKANINIPDTLPQGVAVLNVRRAGQKPPPRSADGPSIGLALTIDAPQQVFVRGHGLDAEMGGKLKIGGTAAAPTIRGGFDLRHGTFSMAGQTLNFTSGKVAFGGMGLVGKLDPSLDFVAQSTTSALTATLTVTGYADAPKLQLSSTPELPQDEILGQLLFRQSVQQLSPFQLAAIAQAAASFGGVGGSDPLASVRSGLGLDRLSVNAASGTSSGATVEAGKYVANGVYVGAKQGTSGGSQAQVQIDLAKHFKVQTTLGTGGTPATGITPENDPGSSIGLTYGFEY